MKKLFKHFGLFLMLALFVAGCQEDDKTFGSLDAPSNIKVTYEIMGKSAENPYGDGSGAVKFTATADNAVSFKYIFIDETKVTSGGIYTKRFNKNGINTYTVSVVANGKGGVTSNTSLEVTVFSNFSDPEAIDLLTNGASKTWYWAAAEPGHLGVGPNNSDTGANYLPGYYAAAPFEKAGSPDSSCLYENELTFTKDGEVLKYALDNHGKTFFNAGFGEAAGQALTGDLCVTYNTAGLKTVALGPSGSLVAPEHTRGTSMTFSDNGFMGYYIGTSTYEIISLTENRMVVRAIPGNDPSLAWYHTFSTQPPVQNPNPGTPEDFTNLVWSDEFETPGAPDPAYWSYNTGTGDNGWGNNEAQYYTNSATNVKVEGGVLKLTAKKEILNGSQYTSARIVTDAKFSFKYGKIVVRAKLPTGGGTWPAIWMLGQNYSTAIWPACGEIDMMEHKGNEPNVIHGTLHYPGHSGGNADTATTTITNASSEFHLYKIIWSATAIKFYVDDTLYHSYANTASSPYNNPFFIVLNVAMGGTFGGTIDPAFTQSTMEVDYVKVYQ